MNGPHGAGNMGERPMTKTNRRIALAGLSAGLMAMTALTGAAHAQSINLTYLIPSGADGVAVADRVVMQARAHGRRL